MPPSLLERATLEEVKNMRKHFLITTFIAFFMMFSAMALAQHGGMHGAMMHGGGMRSPGTGQQQMMGHGMPDHMAMMACMMDDMHRMMVQGQMAEEHHRQMMDMMSRMGQMMEQMAGPHGQHLEQQHSHELQDMRDLLDRMISEVGEQAKKSALAQEE
jgi:hypothetical protein